MENERAPNTVENFLNNFLGICQDYASHNAIKRNNLKAYLAEIHEKFSLMREFNDPPNEGLADNTGELNPLVFVAAAMANLADDYHSAGGGSPATNQLNALHAAFELAAKLNLMRRDSKEQIYDDLVYVSGLLFLDRPRITTAWQEERAKLYDPSKPIKTSLPEVADQIAQIILGTQNALAQKSNVAIAPEVWLPIIHEEVDEQTIPKEVFEAYIVAPTRIMEITDKDAENPIDIEAFFIDAVETLYELRYHASNDPKTFDLVMKAESFLVPAMSDLDFGRLADALKSEANKVRLRYAGYTEAVEQAENTLRDLGDNLDIIYNLQEILENLFGSRVRLDLPDLSSSSDEGVLSSNGIVKFARNGINVSSQLKYRLKTVGSLAWNHVLTSIERAYKVITGEMSEEEAAAAALKPEMDLVGVKIIADNEVHLERVVAQVAENILLAQEYELLHLNPPPGRDVPFHVRGIEDFCENFKEILNECGAKGKIDSRIEAEREQMHIIKVTFFNQLDNGNSPTELQIVTEEYDDLMELGELDHVSYKAKVTIDANTRVVWSRSRKINRSRRGLMSSSQLLSKNRKAAEKELAEIFNKSEAEVRRAISRTATIMALNAQ
ncbi:hypothetical protein FWH58_02670 [Candidatus Saccharibacteria bacterium]|nr:hypothetical protein [Candidatus Saccharibacteria bacterium]